MTMKFQPEPPPIMTRRDWKPVVEELRQHPGEWTMIAAYPPENKMGAYNLSGSIRYGRYKAFLPAEDYAVVARRTEAGTEVWASYKGEV